MRKQRCYLAISRVSCVIQELGLSLSRELAHAGVHALTAVPRGICEDVVGC